MNSLTDPQGPPEAKLVVWRRPRPGWLAAGVALLVMVFGFVLAAHEWQFHVQAAKLQARQQLAQQAQELALGLQGDLRALELLLRATEASAQPLGETTPDSPRAASIALARTRASLKRLHPHLLAIPIQALLHVSLRGAGPAAAPAILWGPEARASAGLSPPEALLLETVWRQAAAAQGAQQADSFLATTHAEAPGLIALAESSAEGGLSLALISKEQWVAERLFALGLVGLRVRLLGESGRTLFYQASDWPQAAAETDAALRLSVAPASWSLEVLPGHASGEQGDGPALALSYLFGSNLLALLILLLGGQRTWLQRKVAEMTAELTSSRVSLQRALAVTREGVAEFVMSTQRLHCSDRLLTMLGLPLGSQASLRKVLRMVCKEDRLHLAKALRSCARTGSALDETIQLRDDTGPERWLRVRALSQMDAVGQVLRVTAAVSDISGQIAQRHQLERYKDFLDGLMNALPVPLSVKDESLRWIMVNHAFCEVEGRPASDFLGRRSPSLSGEEAGARLEAMDREALASGQRQTACLWMPRPGGERSYVRISKIRCTGPDGRRMVLTSAEDLTQLQEEQERQSKLHRFYQNIFDALPHPVFVKDEQHRYVMINRAHAESRGCSKAEIIGTRAPEHDPENITGKAEQEEEAIFDGTAPPMVENEYRLPDPQGGLRSVVVRKVALQGLDGRPMVVGINTDITALRDMESSLRGALHRFSVLYENAPLGIALLDARGRLMDANPYFLRMTGHERTEALHLLTHRDLSPAHEHALDDERAVEVLKKGYCEPFAKHYLHKDGHEIPVMVSGVAVREGELVTQVWGLVQDTSERDAALAAFRQSEVRWQFALEGAGDGVWDWDVRTNKVYFSPRWKTMLGHEESEISDSLNEWSSRVHPDDLPATLAAVEAHVEGHAPVYVSEHRMRCKDGQYKWILDRGKVLERDAEGRPKRLIGTHTDISDRKAVENEVRGHRDSLAEMVREQTEGLRFAKEAAERALEAKSLFLANMSHELRTPMHAVLSFAKLGESRANEASPDKLLDYFARIKTSGERLMHLLNDLLDLSKFEAGHMRVDPVPLDLAQVIREVGQEFEAWLASRDTNLHLELAMDLPLARADYARIGQVLRNLLSNAIKFTAEGKTIMIKLQRAALPRGRRITDVNDVPALEIRVIDQGPGIPPNELETVFEKFVQSSATRTGAGGTGLGLAICREIVAAHRGRIFARNRPEGGAEFVVQLPAETERPALPGQGTTGDDKP